MRLKRSREEGAMTPLGVDPRSALRAMARSPLLTAVADRRPPERKRMMRGDSALIPSAPHLGEVPCRP